VHPPVRLFRPVVLAPRAESVTAEQWNNKDNRTKQYHEREPEKTSIPSAPAKARLATQTIAE